MANVATMGPPPSPKEPRRSGRRPAPSSSKSPVGSPPSEPNPKPKDNPVRPQINPGHTNGRNKRAKNEDIEEPLEELHKNGITSNGGPRSKRKGKEKEKIALVVQIPNDENDGNQQPVGDDAPGEGGEEEEEGGITRCICQKYGEEENEQGEFMVQCEICKAWQHGQCMHYEAAEIVPQHYFCEECKPDVWMDVIRAWAAKHARQASSNSHPPPTPTMANPPRSSRSHSPAVSKTTKRRNTMNSRDAAYDEDKYAHAFLEGSKADYDLLPRTPISAVSLNGGLNGHIDLEQETEVPTNPKRKRKRSDDDAASMKRTRSASITSDRPPPSLLGRDATPLNIVKGPPGPPSTTSTVRTTNTRIKRGGGRKSLAQDLASVDGDEVPSAAPTRKTNNRVKSTNGSEITSRRTQGNPAGSTATGASGSRAYHHSHAYAVSQQPLFTSWNLPDYLAHLEPMLPTDIPRPLEVRGSVLDGNSRESVEHTTERGVKVKWPSKRMSVGDMNKRVRSLVEWVGREQASAMERSRRKEALGKALQAQERVGSVGEGESMNIDAPTGDHGIARENGLSNPDPVGGRATIPGSGEDSTMKMMEELMEELIRFQERFGPGAKTKERDRRAGAL